jgi:hypothetical protein
VNAKPACQFGIGGRFERALAQAGERDLRLAALQYREDQTQQDVVAAIEAGRAAGGVAAPGGALGQAREFALHLQRPAGFAREPADQVAGMLARERETRIGGGQQRPVEQRRQRAFALFGRVPGQCVGEKRRRHADSSTGVMVIR